MMAFKAPAILPHVSKTVIPTKQFVSCDASTLFKIVAFRLKKISKTANYNFSLSDFVKCFLASLINNGRLLNSDVSAVIRPLLELYANLPISSPLLLLL